MEPPTPPAPLEVGLNAVIVAVTDDEPRVLTIERPEPGGGRIGALPAGPLDAARDRTLELALRRWVRELSGVELGYVEQLYTFGNRDRDPRERQGGPRMLSIAYLALVREATLVPLPEAAWRGIYDFLPWEDWRVGRPEAVLAKVESALERWIAASGERDERRRRRERVDIAFGLRGAPWVGERALDRFELLYECRAVDEARRDRPDASGDGGPHRLGRAMALDHRRILASAVGRMRGKLRYRPVVFELLPATFTLLHLQRSVEALAGRRLHKQNFRRLVEQGGLVEGTGKLAGSTGGRPAELFRFRREVLRERPAPGVGLPGLRAG